MSLRYEETRSPRFVIETVDGRDQIAVKPERNLFLILFLIVWLGGWTIAGVSTFTTLLSKGFQPFLAFWLCGWALGEALVVTTLCWMLTGTEILRVPGSDLEVSHRILG